MAGMTVENSGGHRYRADADESANTKHDDFAPGVGTFQNTVTGVNNILTLRLRQLPARVLPSRAI